MSFIVKRCDICHINTPPYSYVQSTIICNHYSNIGVACESYDTLERRIIKLTDEKERLQRELINKDKIIRDLKCTFITNRQILYSI